MAEYVGPPSTYLRRLVSPQRWLLLLALSPSLALGVRVMLSPAGERWISASPSRSRD